MPITRAPIADTPGAFLATGTDGADVYLTLDGDLDVRMLGGNDTVEVDGRFLDPEGFSLLDLYGGSGNDRLTLPDSPSGSILYGNSGNDVIRVATGDEPSGAVGGVGDDTLIGLSGGVVLNGGPGKDALRDNAEAGHSYLQGGPGKDYIFCGGNDEILFQDGDTGRGVNRDRVIGFDEPGSLLNISSIDADPGADGDQAFAFDGMVASGSAPVEPGHAQWFIEGPHAVARWNSDGVVQAVVLENVGEIGLSQSDFWL